MGKMNTPSIAIGKNQNSNDHERVTSTPFRLPTVGSGADQRVQHGIHCQGNEQHQAGNIRPKPADRCQIDQQERRYHSQQHYLDDLAGAVGEDEASLQRRPCSGRGNVWSVFTRSTTTNDPSSPDSPPPDTLRREAASWSCSMTRGFVPHRSCTASRSMGIRRAALPVTKSCRACASAPREAVEQLVNDAIGGRANETGRTEIAFADAADRTIRPAVGTASQK